MNPYEVSIIEAKRQAGAEAARRHFAADMLIKGTYFSHYFSQGAWAGAFRGCSVGCLAHEIDPNGNGNYHMIASDAFGYPIWLAFLQDTIFEGLPNGIKGENCLWHVQLMETIAKLPASFDWGLALHRVHISLLRLAHPADGSMQEIIQRVIDLHERKLRGEFVSHEDWEAQGRAAFGKRLEPETFLQLSAASTEWIGVTRSAQKATSLVAYWVTLATETHLRVHAYEEVRDAVLAAIPEPDASNVGSIPNG